MGKTMAECIHPSLLWGKDIKFQGTKPIHLLSIYCTCWDHHSCHIAFLEGNLKLDCLVWICWIIQCDVCLIFEACMWPLIVQMMSVRGARKIHKGWEMVYRSRNASQRTSAPAQSTLYSHPMHSNHIEKSLKCRDETGICKVACERRTESGEAWNQVCIQWCREWTCCLTIQRRGVCARPISQCKLLRPIPWKINSL